MEFLTLDDPALLRQCEVDTFRSSGPGGQKRNKTSSGVRLRHKPTGLMVTAVEDRSQHVNKARALRRLRAAIAMTVRQPLRNDYEPSEILRSCVNQATHIAVGKRDQRYTLVVAEILDVLTSVGNRLSDAAKLLRMPTSHLVSFLEGDPKLWQCVNQFRAGSGLKPLR